MNKAIIIVNYNQGDLLNKQLHLIKKFCPEPDRYVINNGSHPSEAEKIIYWANRHGAHVVNADCKDSDPSVAHGFGCNLGYQLYNGEYDILFFLDHDMFMLKPFSLDHVMNGHAIGGLAQVRRGLKYYWPGLVILNLKYLDRKKIDFYPCEVKGVRLDTGGGLYHAIHMISEERQLDFAEKYVQTPHFKNKNYDNYSMLGDDQFMHFRNASNWAGIEGNEGRINGLKQILDEKTK